MGNSHLFQKIFLAVGFTITMLSSSACGILFPDPGRNDPIVYEAEITNSSQKVIEIFHEVIEAGSVGGCDKSYPVKPLEPGEKRLFSITVSQCESSTSQAVSYKFPDSDRESVNGIGNERFYSINCAENICVLNKD